MIKNVDYKYRLIIEEVGDVKVPLIKSLRAIFKGSLKHLRGLIQDTPRVFAEELNREQAYRIKYRIERESLAKIKIERMY